MSDFQDEQGLGELPADLQNQYLQQFAPTPGGQAATLSIPASPPSNLTGDSPKYPVSVDSVFQTLPINAKDMSVSGGDFMDLNYVPSDSDPLSSPITGVSTLYYKSSPSFVDIIKKLKWEISVERFFAYNNLTSSSNLDTIVGVLNVYVGGIVVNGLADLQVHEKGELDVNIIVPENTLVFFTLDFRGTYGQIAGTIITVNGTLMSFMDMQMSGYSLLGRGYPPNFEIGS